MTAEQAEREAEIEALYRRLERLQEHSAEYHTAHARLRELQRLEAARMHAVFEAGRLSRPGDFDRVVAHAEALLAEKP